MKKHKVLKIVSIVISFFILLIIGLLVYWNTGTYQADKEALLAMEGNSSFTVTKTDSFFVFTPKDAQLKKDLVFVFYPGARVEYESYSLLLGDLATLGYECVLVPMPLNLAVLAGGRGTEVLSLYPNNSNVIFGGHSLGGAMASDFSLANQDKVKGVAYLGAYPNKSLEGTALKTVSLYGSEDLIATKEKIFINKSKLPENNILVEIEGGNHSQFGSYGKQAGDGKALISSAEQRAEIVRALEDFFKSLEIEEKEKVV